MQHGEFAPQVHSNHQGVGECVHAVGREIRGAENRLYEYTFCIARIGGSLGHPEQHNSCPAILDASPALLFRLSCPSHSSFVLRQSSPVHAATLHALHYLLSFFEFLIGPDQIALIWVPGPRYWLHKSRFERGRLQSCRNRPINLGLQPPEGCFSNERHQLIQPVPVRACSFSVPLVSCSLLYSQNTRTFVWLPSLPSRSTVRSSR